MNAGKRRREFVERLILFGACAFLLLLGGMLLARYNKFPYSLLEDSMQAAGAVAIRLGWMKDSDTGTVGTDGERVPGKAGVTHYEAALTSPGYTLIAAGSEEDAVLIDMAGRRVHRWNLPIGVIRERYGEGSLPPEAPISWRSFHMFANGDLLVVLHGATVTPYGFGIFKLDKDSNLLWANLDHAHHDVAVSEDGLIYTITQEIRKTNVAGLEGLEPPILEDFVLVLSPDGRQLHRISVMEAFSGTPYASAVDKLVKGRNWKGDYFHVNSIEPYDSGNETPVLRKNQVLISVRNLDAVATLDLDSGKIAWLLRGSWLRQHDIDVHEGRIMLFDNRGDFSRGGRSRVLEVDPVTEAITWKAGANEQYDLYSGWAGNQQPLDNGNVLINESVHGRLLEITRDGRLAWEYYEDRKDVSGDYAAPIMEAKRYPATYFGFELNGE